MAKKKTESTTTAETAAELMESLVAKGKLNARNADLHWLYEQSVQNVEFEAKFIDRVFRKEYDRKPSFLREDFCGTALLCAEWVRQRRENSALGVDYDGPTLEWGRRNNIAPLGERALAVALVKDDVRNVKGEKADVIAAMNFSWWGMKTREELGGYFRSCHSNLRREGMLVLDCYGGPEAQVPQFEEREQEGFEYVWDQDQFNPITGEVVNMIHFRFPDGSEMKKAFRYDWRLWSLPETRDLLADCGFRKTVVFWEGTDKDGEPSGVFRPSEKGDLAPAWVAYIVAYR